MTHPRCKGYTMKLLSINLQGDVIGIIADRRMSGQSYEKLRVAAGSALMVFFLAACSSSSDTTITTAAVDTVNTVKTERPAVGIQHTTLHSDTVGPEYVAPRPSNTYKLSPQAHRLEPEIGRPLQESRELQDTSQALIRHKIFNESAVDSASTQLSQGGQLAFDSTAGRHLVVPGHDYPQPIRSSGRPPINQPEWTAPHVMHDRNKFAESMQNPIVRVANQPVSTFAVDVDTGSYSMVRRYIESGSLPPVAAVRVEEMINYFDYDYPLPTDVSQPFSVITEVAPSPWAANRHLVHIGLKGFTPESIGIKRPAANLVFLVDVSGSMQDSNKLPLLKSSLRLLSKQLTEDDRISIVVYAGASGVVLEPTPGNHWQLINQALGQLRAGGSTNGAAGINLAYHLAKQSFIEKGVNRVILATDGDFNVGVSDTTRLKEIISVERSNKISLTTLGFGSGNYNDELMEQLADTGNGNYAYIDTLSEAQKVLIEELDSTLMTIAKDVKVQIEFNPAQVSEYRLIGYENRKLANEDFANDKIDAGEIGAGHTVTALYEIALVASGGEIHTPLRYKRSHENPQGSESTQDSGGELLELRLRYKPLYSENGEDVKDKTQTIRKIMDSDASERSRLISKVVLADDVRETLSDATPRFRFSAAVAVFGQLLKGGKYTGDFSIDDIVEMTQESLATDERGLRREFLKLAKLASGVFPNAPQSASIGGKSSRDLDESDQSG